MGKGAGGTSKGVAAAVTPDAAQPATGMAQSTADSTVPVGSGLRIGVLGPLLVQDGVAAVEVGGARLRALLARLALDAGRLITVEALVDALWPDAPPADALNALQSLVSRLRRALPDPALVDSRPGGYRLAIDPDAVDLNRFERLARQGREALGSGRPGVALPLLTEALQLWRGPALAELQTGSPAGTAGAAATRLDELRLQAVEDRVEAALQLGRHHEVLSELATLCREHPLREGLSTQYMRALYAAGRQAEALAAYEGTRQALASQLGVDPSPGLQAVHLAVLRADPALLPPVPAPRRAPTNLRVSLTSFIGRTADLAALAALLDRFRLVTLVGPGGAGKTRLAVEAASALATADGVWLVELAPLRDPADLPATVLAALGLRETAVLDGRDPATPLHRDARDRLVDALVARPALLILDNCEHVVQAAAELAGYLLTRCPQVRVLATSRQALGVVGERLHPVDPLDLPAEAAEPAEAAATPAVRLFVERAAAVRPGFAVDAATLGPVVQICRRLDGLPLALELAAARLRALPVDVVAQRLDDRFRLLRGGNRAADERHRTLWAVVAWSWDLLPEPEQRLAERISVFAGPVTADAAAAVLTGSGPGGSEQLEPDQPQPARPEPAQPEPEVLDLLAALADKSLLQVVEGSTVRYRMLETIREFGQQRLTDAGQLARARAAHARHFLALAEAADPYLRGPDQLSWLARLDEQRDDLHAAVRYAAEAGDADTAVRLAAALSWYWTLTGQQAEAVSAMTTAAAVPGEAPARARTIVAVVLAMAEQATGRPLDAERWELLQRELEQVPDLADDPMLALSSAVLALFRDEHEHAAALIDRQLDHADPWTRSGAHFLAGIVAENAGDAQGAREHLTIALAGFRSLGERWGIAQAGTALAGLQLLDDVPAAIAGYEEAAEILEQLRSHEDLAQVRLRLAFAHARVERLDRAQDLIEQARASVVQAQSQVMSTVMAAFLEFAVAELHRRRGDLAGCRSRQQAALDQLQASPSAPPQITAVVLAGMAGLDLFEHRPAEARQRLAEAWGLAVGMRDMPVAAVVLMVIVTLELERGDPASAARLLGASDALRGAPDNTDPERADLIARLHAALGVDGFRRAHAEGLRHDRDQALALGTAALDTAALGTEAPGTEAPGTAVLGPEPSPPAAQARRR